MRILILLCCLIVIALATPRALQQDTQWQQFKLNHSKIYETVEEEQQRFEIFYDNLKEIEKHNKLYDTGLISYRLGINQFTDWTQEEFVSYLTKFEHSPQKYDGTFVRPLNVQLPSAIDWRQKGVVTPPIDQERCGSCWAVSTTGALEGQRAIKTGKLESLSVQELVDCSTTNRGCRGGLMINAFEYVRENGLTTEEAYPYEAKQGECRSTDKPRVVYATGYHEIEPENEDDLEAAVGTIGPVSLIVDARYWGFYKGGIYTGDCYSTKPDLNHAVLAVGYGTDKNGMDYWTIKNSWGTRWGEGGFMKLPRHQNKCGVATGASYPVL